MRTGARPKVNTDPLLVEVREALKKCIDAYEAKNKLLAGARLLVAVYAIDKLIKQYGDELAELRIEDGFFDGFDQFGRKVLLLALTQSLAMYVQESAS